MLLSAERKLLKIANVPTVKAVFWMLLSIVLSLALAVAGRKLLGDINVIQVMEMRSVIALAMLWPLVCAEGGVRAMRTDKLLWHIGRNGAHYLGQMVWLLALTLIPLAEVTAIEFTAPIWAALMAGAFLAEPLTWRKTLGILIAFVGVVLIVNPASTALNPGHLLVLFSAFVYAVFVITAKSLAGRESATKIIFWMLIIQSLIGLVPAMTVWKWPAPPLLPWILLIAFAGTFAHFCVAQALRHADAMVVMPIEYLIVPLSAVAGCSLYGEGFSMPMIVGALLIVAGNLLHLKRVTPTALHPPQ